MKLNIQITGTEKFSLAMARIGSAASRVEMAQALNTGANAYIVPAMKKQLEMRIDRVTPFVLKSVRLVSKATPSNLSIQVGPSYRSDLGTKGGKIGVDPQQVLQAQQLGGPRRDKRSEAILSRAGILPAGYQLAIPDTPFPGSDDGHGNLRGPFVVQLLSYFKTFGEQGYKANMGDRARLNLARGGAASRLAKVAGPTLGRRYLVAYGKMRGGARIRINGEPDMRASNLAPGIWAVLGTTGAVVKPVVMFVKAGKYTPRINMDLPDQIGEIERQIGALARARIYKAAGL